MHYDLFNLSFYFVIIIIATRAIESIMLHSFSKNAFKYGITIFKGIIEIESKELNGLEEIIYKKKEGKFKFTKNTVYFLSQINMFDFTRIRIIPIKITGKIQKDNTIDIVAKIQIGSTVNLLVAFIFICLMFSEKSEGLGIIEPLIIILIIFSIIIIFSYAVEKNKLEVMLKELKSFFTEENSSK